MMTFSAIPSCPARSVGLVRYPTTLAPASGSFTVTTQCADNAHVRTASSLSVGCSYSGSWTGTTPQCGCDAGYRAVTVSGSQICQSKHFSIAIILSNDLLCFLQVLIHALLEILV